jgi:hypothetical protein
MQSHQRERPHCSEVEPPGLAGTPIQAGDLEPDQEAVVSLLRGALLSFGLLFVAFTAPAHCEPAPEAAPNDDVLFGPGLICDTKDQAERFVSLLGDGVESALGIVNREAGIPDACLVTAMGFKRGEIVSEVLRNGAIFDVIEVTVMAVTTPIGLQPIEPKKYFSIVATGDRIA